MAEHREDLELFFDDLTESEFEQISVLREAFLKFRERNAKYDDLWKDGGAEDSLHHMRHKLARCEILMTWAEGGRELQLDDAIDLINYTVFFIRNIKEGRYWAQARPGAPTMIAQRDIKAGEVVTVDFTTGKMG